MIGFAMKTAVADTLSPLVEAVFSLASPTLVDSWTGAVAYTLQLYFDFAGYSLMAIGLARMIGFHFPQNFNTPYLSGSIQDFWQRWHMTLSRFLRDYLYIPFGGNRKGAGRTYVNLMMVMAIGGLWHGSSWNFIIWGVWHGGMLAGHRWWQRRPDYRPMPYALGNAMTMLGVLLGWVVFRAKDLAESAAMLGGMIGMHGVAMSDQLAWQATPDRMWFIPIAAALIYWPLLRERLGRPQFGSVVQTLAPLAGFVLAMVLLYSRDAVPFLYFQF
jgi:alginate O-acetyltransferase complex protein AlgI